MRPDSVDIKGRRRGAGRGEVGGMHGGWGWGRDSLISLPSLPVDQLRRLLTSVRNVHLKIVIVLEVVVVVLVVSGRVQLRLAVLVVHGVPAPHGSSLASSPRLDDQGDEEDEQDDCAEGRPDDESSAVVGRQEVLLVGFWVVHVQHARTPSLGHLEQRGTVVEIVTSPKHWLVGWLVGLLHPSTEKDAGKRCSDCETIRRNRVSERCYNNNNNKNNNTNNKTTTKTKPPQQHNNNKINNNNNKNKTTTTKQQYTTTTTTTLQQQHSRTLRCAVPWNHISTISFTFPASNSRHWFPTSFLQPLP